MKKKLSKLFIVSLILLFSLFLYGLFYLVFDIDMQRCQMTYMFEYPEFKKYDIPKLKKNDTYKWYELYRYSEGGNDDDRRRGIPVLFIPGNSGSYKQVRSLASVSRQISLQKHDHQMFDYFSVDLNDELSGLSGFIVDRQTKFVSSVILYLSGLYQGNSEIILVGHSMGGVIARAVLMLLENEGANVKVRLIICLASPIALPVVGVDSQLVAIYRSVTEHWLRNNNTMIVSITGGNRDLLVWDGYGRIVDGNNGLWVPAGCIRELWSSTDHLCIVWCRQLVVRIVKVLYRLQQVSFDSKQIAESPEDLKAAFRGELMSDEIEHGYGSVAPVQLESCASLLLFTCSIDVPVEGGQKYLILEIGKPAVSVTRPLRLQVESSDCAKGIRDWSVAMSYMGLLHKYHVGNDNSVLLSTPITSFSSSGEHHGNMTVRINLASNCRKRTIHIRASLIDWTAQLIRIHVGRVPCVISALLVLDLFRSGPLSLPALAVAVYVGLIGGGGGNGGNLHSFGLARLYGLAIIDMLDLVLLFAICLPLAKLLLAISSILLRIIHIICNHCCPAALLGIFRAYSIILFIPSVLVALAAPDVPVLVTMSAAGPFFITSAMKVSMETKYFHQSRIGGILLLIALLQLPQFIAEFHSVRQHESILNAIRQLLIGSKNVSSYWKSSSFVLPVLVAISTINDVDVKVSSTINLLIYSSIPVVLASGCILYGCIDISQCIPFLLSSLVALTTLNYLISK